MAKVLVLGAGGPAGVNTCRALKAADHEVWIHDENPAHLELALPFADEVLPGLTVGHFDLVLPQPDSLVLRHAQMFSEVGGTRFQPSLSTILVCQDKFEAGLAWRR